MTLAIESHQLKLLAMAWLDRHWDELPRGAADEEHRWIADLTAEFEAALEDRAREWLEKKS